MANFNDKNSLQASSLEAYLLEIHFRKKEGHVLSELDDPSSQYIGFYDETDGLWIYLGQKTIQTGLNPKSKILKELGVTWGELTSHMVSPEGRKALYQKKVGGN